MYMRCRYTCTSYFLHVLDVPAGIVIQFIESSLTYLVPKVKTVEFSVARLGDLTVCRSVATTCVRIDFYPSEVIVNRPGGV